MTPDPSSPAIALPRAAGSRGARGGALAPDMRPARPPGPGSHGSSTSTRARWPAILPVVKDALNLFLRRRTGGDRADRQHHLVDDPAASSATWPTTPAPAAWLLPLSVLLVDGRARLQSGWLPSYAAVARAGDGHRIRSGRLPSGGVSHRHPRWAGERKTTRRPRSSPPGVNIGIALGPPV